MTAILMYKVYFILGVVISVGLTSLADNDAQDSSKYEYGYVISHKGGGTQAHLESRDGNLALGRYYVNLHNGTGQKVTYFADDLGFHSGVSYSSQNGKGYSKTEIAVGQKALAALGNPGTEQNSAPTVSSPTLLFGSKILKTALETITPKPTNHPKLNYTPVPGGFYLTHESIDPANDTTRQPAYIAGLTSQGFNAGKHPEVVPQNTGSTQTFYPTSENVKNQINQLHVQFTTPSIKSYTSGQQQTSVFSGDGSPQRDQNVKVSTYATSFNDLSYSKEKSIEKTNFADIDSQILSEVQKHAEQIIMKDLQKSQDVNLQDDFARFSSGVYYPSTPTMQPIVVTNAGETGITNIISTTAIPDVGKASKNLQSGTINAVKISEKNSDQTLQDSGYFRVSLSPSFSSSINVSQTPHQSINAGSTDRNSVSNSTVCELSSCGKDEIFAIDLITDKPVTKSVDSLGSSSQNALGGNKLVHTFYPENKLHDERHYITTIDVQKAISLDVNPIEAGNIRLVQNYPFNKIKPVQQIQTQYSPPPHHQTVPVAPALYVPQSNLNVLNTPPKPYILNTVTTTPGLFDVTSNQNLAVLQGLNDISGHIQYGAVVHDRVSNSRLGYENQLVVPPAPVSLTNEAADAYRQRQEDIQAVEKSIQQLRQHFLSNIDEQHEEEQRKQNLVDEERKQYFENLKKVEDVKSSYGAVVNSENDGIHSTPSPISSVESANNVELIPEAPQEPQYKSGAPPQPYEAAPQTDYQPTPQPQYEQPSPPPYIPQQQTYQTEIKDFIHEVAVPQAPVQQVSNVEVYQKQVLPYNRNIQAPNSAPQLGIFDSHNVFAIDNNIQQSEKIQVGNHVSQIPSVAFQPRLQVPQTEEKPKNVQLTLLNSQINSVPVSLPSQVLPSAKVGDNKPLLVNRVLPVDYSRLLHVKQPISLFPTYQIPLTSGTKFPEIYPQQLALPLQVSQTYKFLPYQEILPISGNKQYHSTLTQKTNNKVRVQPLKPSTPDDEGQRELVRNLLAQPQFHQTYIYPGLPVGNRIQLRHTRKNHFSNSDQVRSQSVIRRGKSLKNLRIEYGFKPPLRPSVEFTEELKPSIYGPSVPPQ